MLRSPEYPIPITEQEIALHRKAQLPELNTHYAEMYERGFAFLNHIKAKTVVMNTLATLFPENEKERTELQVFISRFVPSRGDSTYLSSKEYRDYVYSLVDKDYQLRHLPPSNDTKDDESLLEDRMTQKGKQSEPKRKIIFPNDSFICDHFCGYVWEGTLLANNGYNKGSLFVGLVGSKDNSKEARNDFFNFGVAYVPDKIKDYYRALPIIGSDFNRLDVEARVHKNFKGYSVELKRNRLRATVSQIQAHLQKIITLKLQEYNLTLEEHILESLQDSTIGIIDM